MIDTATPKYTSYSKTALTFLSTFLGRKKAVLLAAVVFFLFFFKKHSKTSRKHNSPNTCNAQVFLVVMHEVTCKLGREKI